VSEYRGQKLHAIGKSLFWIGLVGSSVSLAVRSELSSLAILAFGWGGIVVAFLGIAIMHRGRKLLAASGEQRLASDPRKPVVYLRSFAADALGAGAVGSWLLLKLNYSTDEEQLAAVMNEFGPFIAIGAPGETLPTLGANRIYTGEGDWRMRVQALLQEARLVVLRAGTTENFWWEFQAVRACVPPERVLLLVNSRGASYQAFRARAAAILPSPLPDLRRWTRALSSVRAIIAFDESWNSRELPIVSSFRHSAFTAPFVGRLKLTLRPIYDRLGVVWVPPPVARKKMIVLGTLGTIGTLAAALALAIIIPDYLNSPLTYTPVELIATSSTAAVPSDGRSRYDAQLEILTARLSSEPAFRKTVEGMSDEKARESARQLSMRGLVRLSDEQLAIRARVLTTILSLSDVMTCAAIFKGGATPGLEAAIRRLPDADTEEWFEIVYASTVAELQRQRVPAPATTDRVQQAFDSLISQLPPAEAKSLRLALTEPQRTGAEQACAAAKLFYGTLPVLSADDRAVLARAVLSR
jgi:hypothetical protein